MDYTSAPLWFRLRKTWRYVTMYGPSRTLVKVRGQYHMKRRFEELPPRTPPTDRQIFGLIGCGNYAFSNIAFYLTKEFPRSIRSCMDIDPHRAASLASTYKVPVHTTDPEEILSDPGIKLVFIASNHASHAEYAIKALEAGKSVYIEKPHVVGHDQLRRLLDTMDGSDGQVFLGFNRPGSRFGRIMDERLSAHEGPMVINWFVAGHQIDPDHWYFRPEEGGRVLGNLCHWTDFTLHLVGEQAFPVRVVPARHDQSDSNVAVSFVFGDGTVAAITFSAKGHTFEGVMERVAIHRGDCLLTMDDYRTMTVREGPRKKGYLNLFRDHGHRRNIVAAARSVVDGAAAGASREMRQHLEQSGRLMLATKDALEKDEVVVIA